MNWAKGPYALVQFLMLALAALMVSRPYLSIVNHPFTFAWEVVTIESAMFSGQSYIEIRRNSITPRYVCMWHVCVNALPHPSSTPTMVSFSLEFRTRSSDGLIFWHGLVCISETTCISLLITYCV